MEFNAEIVSVVLGGILAAKGLAMYIVNTTDTPRDDKWVGTAYKVVEKVAGILNDDKAKQLPGENEEDVKAGKIGNS